MMKRLGLLLGLAGVLVAPAAAGAPPLKVKPHHVTFGTQAAQSVTTETIEVTNVGDSTVFLAPIDRFPDDFGFDEVASSCLGFDFSLVGIQLAAGASCTYAVRFFAEGSTGFRDLGELTVLALPVGFDPLNPFATILDSVSVKISGTTGT